MSNRPITFKLISYDPSSFLPFFKMNEYLSEMGYKFNLLDNSLDNLLDSGEKDSGEKDGGEKDEIKVDYYIVIDFHPNSDCYEDNKSFVIQRKPEIIHKRWGTPDICRFIKIFPNFIHWTIPIISTITKTKTLSTILSNYSILEGHHHRQSLFPLLDSLPFFDLYGYHYPPNQYKRYQGTLPDDNKGSGLYPYKYTIVIESVNEPNYVTEKLIDAILAECLVFYWGCPNLSTWLDERVIIRLDFSNVEETVKLITSAIENDEWSKRIDIIRSEKKKILTELNIICQIRDTLKKREEQANFFNRQFDKIYCINLDRSKDRWTQSSAQFSLYNLDVQRFPAIDGSTANPKVAIEEGIITPRNEDLHKGALGVILSNVKIWKEIVEKRYKWTLIFEDDVAVHPLCLESFPNYWNSTPTDAEIILLSYIIPKKSRIAKVNDYAVPINNYVVKLKKMVNGANAYAVSLKGAEKLLKEYLPICRTLDYFPPDKFNIYGYNRINSDLVSSCFYQNKSMRNGKIIYHYTGIFSVREVPSTICYTLIPQFSIDQLYEKFKEGSIKSIGSENEFENELIFKALYNKIMRDFSVDNIQASLLYQLAILFYSKISWEHIKTSLFLSFSLNPHNLISLFQIIYYHRQHKQYHLAYLYLSLINPSNMSSTSHLISYFDEMSTICYYLPSKFRQGQQALLKLISLPNATDFLIQHKSRLINNLWFYSLTSHIPSLPSLPSLPSFSQILENRYEDISFYY